MLYCIILLIDAGLSGEGSQEGTIPLIQSVKRMGSGGSQS
jgi:hypothetical protein